MAETPSKCITVYSDGSYKLEILGLPPLFMHREDKEALGGIRSCAPCPAVFVLNEPNTKVKLTMDWQFYIRAINYNMTLEHVCALLGYERAFTNNTGFGDENNPRVNFLTNNNLGCEYPRFDKDRCCSRTVMTGTKTPDGKSLIIKTFNGNASPPMKEGKPHPQTLSEINIDDYLYNPRDHPYMFLVANIVNADGTVVQFPNGGLYEWTGNDPMVFLPLVSDELITYPMDNLIELPLGSPIPSPYRH